jgi:hypothetical protein
VPPLYRSVPQRNAAIVVAVLMLAIGFVHLFGGPGYEQTLATGLVVPSAAAIGTALELSLREESLGTGVARGALTGAWLAAVAFATAVLQGVRVGMCDLVGGAVDFALGAGFGCILGGVWGALAAELARGRKRRRLACVLLGIALPLGCALVSVWRFYASPMVFAFDPFVGYFSGTLYDTIIETGGALLTYRVGSAATLTFVALASTLVVREGGRFRLVSLRGGSAQARAALAFVALATSVTITALGAKLGHWETPSTIAEALGGRRSGARCDVVFPDSMRPDESALLVKDCEEELASVEAYLGAKGPDRVTAFFFRDPAEKKRLMGAATTYIAKPWRKEVYLQVAPYPHPVLGHELAHVVAGNFGEGPFHVAGLWPNPGLIEGTAVAASPDDDALTDAEWAKAMLDSKMLPPMKSVFSFDFLGENASKSYTIAGAFVRWLVGRFGSAVLRSWYGGGDIEQLTAMSWPSLDAAFRDELAKLVLPPDAVAFAKAKFERPSVFGRTCPHQIDALLHEADKCAQGMEIGRAEALFDRVLSRDAHDFNARYKRAVMNARYGDHDAGRRDLEALVRDPETPRTWRDKSEEAIADDDLLAGRFEDASARYRRLAEGSVEEDEARTLEVKSLAATRPEARRAVEALLIGGDGRAPDVYLAGLWLGVWSNGGDQPLADYLVGKNLANRAYYPLAATFLDRALASPFPTVRIGREIIRSRGVVACALGDAAAVERVKRDVAVEGGPFAGSAGGRRESVERMLARCQRVP